jgi:hypothetical protein
LARQVPGRRREQRAINGPQLWPTDLAAQNLELVPQHHQLDVLHARATTAADEQTKQRSDSEVEEGEEHAADPPSPRQRKT